MLGKRGTGQRLTNAVVTDIGNFAQAIQKAKCLKNAGVYTDAGACVSFFDPLERRTRRECPLSDYRHGQPPSTPSVADVRTQLAKCAPCCHLINASPICWA